MIDHSEAIRAYILEQLQGHPKDIVRKAAQHLGVTRTTIHRHLKQLLKEGAICKSGTTRAARYFLSSSFDRRFSYVITPQLSEFKIYQESFEPAFKELKENIYDIVFYGFTEIVNNAIDHSLGARLEIQSELNHQNLTLTIEDDGIGLFEKIYNYFSLEDLRESVLQLSKGKVTTAPKGHSGEGIFFTSRAFDRFEIIANGLHYYCDNVEKDWSFKTEEPVKAGTCVRMSINKDSDRDLVQIFKQFQNPESLAFDRTEIHVELSQFGEEKLISRSQAKRITRDLDKFKHVTLDFSGIKMAGQGFVDEIFRVYQHTHPAMTIDYVNANEDIVFMLKRSLASI